VGQLRLRTRAYSLKIAFRLLTNSGKRIEMQGKPGLSEGQVHHAKLRSHSIKQICSRVHCIVIITQP